MKIPNEIVTSIKSRGHWRVIVYPTDYQKARHSIPECRKLMAESSVQLRGWYFPHVDKPTVGQDYIHEAVEWHLIREYWRFYQSGQFVHLFGFQEDWEKEAAAAKSLPFGGITDPVEPGTELGFLRLVYRMTEVYAFIQRLWGAAQYNEGAHIEIELHGLEGRRIVHEDRLASLSTRYVATVPKFQIIRDLSVPEISTASRQLAVEGALEVLRRFGLETTPEVVSDWQARFIEGRR